MSYEPLHHKYRPQTFADLVGQDAIATTLRNAIRTQRIAPAYLFTGPRGTGKTSSARILAKSLNCLNSDKPTEKPCGVCDVCRGVAKGSTLDVIEIDAASNTGVDNIREIIERAQFAPVQCRYKVYVIDECHMLSTAAFNSLLKTLEEPPDRVVFVLATTDPQRVLPTIISRCQRFDYRRIPLEAMVTHLSAIAYQEEINIAPEAVRLVAQIAQGGLRDAESLLDQLSLLSGQVTVEQIWELVGSCSEPDLLNLLQAIAEDCPEAILDCARKIMDRGREPLNVLQNLAGFYRDLLIAKTTSNRSDLVTLTAPTWKALCELAHSWDISTILAGQKHLKDSEIQIKQTTVPRLWLEMTLLGLLKVASSSQMVSPAETGIQQNLLKIAHQQQPISNPPQQPNTSVVSTPETSQPPSSENPPLSSPDTHASQIKPVDLESSSTSAEPAERSQEQVWQQVLAQIQPESTKQMLRQFGSLISLEGTVAHVSLPKKWQEKLNVQDKIEVAFQKTLNYRVKVILQAVAPQAKTAHSNQSQQQPPSPPSQLAAVSLPLTELKSYLPPEPAQEEMHPKMGMTEVAHLPQLVPKSELIAELPVPTSTSEPDADEVAIAAQRLAKAVNGEVIGLNLESFKEETIASPLPTTLSTNWDDTDIADEGELDF